MTQKNVVTLITNFFPLLGLDISVNITVLNSETNLNLAGAIVTIEGTNYLTPLIKLFASGTILTLTASKLGFTTETRTITVGETIESLTQHVMFLMSADLVRNVARKSLSPNYNDLN